MRSLLNQRGYTLLEILVVIGIIGMLSTIGMVSYQSAKMSSRDVKRANDSMAIRSALEIYFEFNSSYPSDKRPGMEGLILGEADSAVLTNSGFVTVTEATDDPNVYLQKVPANITPGGSPYIYRSLNLDGKDCVSDSCDAYVILFTLEKGAGSWLAGPHALSTQGVAGAEGGSVGFDVTGAGGIFYGTDIAAALAEMAADTTDAVGRAVNDPAVQQVTEKAVAPTAAVAAAANAAMAAQVTGSAQLSQYLLFFFTQPILALKRRRRKHWGTVYNSLSHLPLDLAIVRLRLADGNRVVKSEVTDKDGRYSFIVPAGAYRLDVSRLEFRFPSEITKGRVEDQQYLDIYHGHEIAVGPEGAVLALNLPVDPAEVPEEIDDGKVIRQERWRRFQRRFAMVGPVLGVGAVVITPSALTVSLLGLQVVTYLFFKRFAQSTRPKNWGVIFDEQSGRPVRNAVVRIFALPYHKLLESKVTDDSGRYNFRVGNGKYYLTVTRQGYLKTETDPIDYSSESTASFVASDIPLRRSNVFKEDAPKPASAAPKAVVATGIAAPAVPVASTPKPAAAVGEADAPGIAVQTITSTTPMPVPAPMPPAPAVPSNMPSSVGTTPTPLSAIDQLANSDKTPKQ